MTRSFNRLVMLLAILSTFVFMAACSSGQQSSGGGSTSTTPKESESNGSSTPAEGEPIKIGVILAETGPASSLGKPEVDSVKLIQKQIEEQGGLVNGQKVEIVIEDYESDDTNAVVAMKKLVSEGVVAVVGATQASTSMAILPIAEEGKIPLMALAPLPKHGDFIFQIPQSNEAVLTKIIDYLKANNISSVAWTNARDAFGQSGLPIFKTLAEQNGIEIVAVEDFDAAATDMTVQLTKIKPKNPGAVIVWSRPPGAGIVAKNFKQLGFNVPMIQSHAVANKGFLDQVGADGEGVLVLGSKLSVLDQIEANEQQKMLADFDQQIKAAYNYPGNAFSGYSYDGVKMVLKAIEEGHTTPEAIQSYLANDMGEYLGVSGTFNFSTTHNGPKADGMVVLEVANGSWKLGE